MDDMQIFFTFSPTCFYWPHYQGKYMIFRKWPVWRGWGKVSKLIRWNKVKDISTPYLGEGRFSFLTLRHHHHHHPLFHQLISDKFQVFVRGTWIICGWYVVNILLPPEVCRGVSSRRSNGEVRIVRRERYIRG